MTERRLSIVIDPTKAEAGGRVVKRTLDEMAQKAKDAEKSVGGFGGAATDNFAKAARGAGVATKALNLLKIAALGVAAALSVGVLKDYADAWSDMQSRVGAAIKNMGAAPAMMRRMVDLANASYSPLEQTVEVYTRNVAVLRDLGYAADGAADFTEALNHALVITATRGERAASVQNALSKAMAVGKLTGDGLETVLSSGGRVAEALAAELGTTVSGLRKMASEGKITGDVIARALTGSLEQLRDEAAKMPATIGDAFTRIQTNTTALVGTLDQAWGVSGRVAEQMLAFADGILAAADVLLRLGNVAGAVLGPAFGAIGGSLEMVAKLAGIAVATLAGFYAPVLIGGIGALITTLSAGLVPALGAVAGALRAVGVAMLANPVGIFIGALALAVTAAFTFRDDIKEAIGVDVVEVFRTGANWIIGSMVGAVKAVQMAWGVYPQFMEALGKEAWNAFISGFEGTAVSWTNPFTGEVYDLVKLDLTDFKHKIDRDSASIAATVGGAVSNAFAEAQSVDYVGQLEGVIGEMWQTAEGAAGGISSLAGEIGGGGGGAGGGLAGAAKKAADEYAKLVQSARSFIAEQENERKTLGLSEEQANASRYAFDLLNKAKEAGLRLTDAQVAELTGLGSQMAAAETETKRLTRAFEEQQRVADEVFGAIGDALSSLFDGPMEGMDKFFDKLFSGFAKLGQSNLSKLFSIDGLQSLFVGPAANDNGPTPVNITNPGDISQKFGEFFKSSGGIGGMASAGLGGLGIGYQTQNPLMGGLGGALSGFAAGGPVGAVIGGLAGVVGGIFGMNKALEEAKQKLREARVGIDQLMATMSGEKISAYAKAAADFEQQTIQAIALAEKAGDFELGARIQAAYDKAGQTLARELNREIERNTNALRGQDYINEASDALELYNSRLRDQVALGQDVVGAQDELALSLQKMIDDAALTASQIDDLARRFPDLADALSKVSLETSKMTSRLLDAQYGFMIEARAEVDRARGDLQRAYEAEAGQLRDIITAAQRAAQSLRQFRDSLRLDQNLSYLNPIDRMNEAQKAFQDVSGKALAGDQEAIGQLEGVSRQYLEEARAYYGTSTQYFQIFDQVESILGQALAKAEQQVTETQAQLNALDSLVSLHIDLNAGVMSVAQAIASLSAAVLNQKAREDEYYGGSGGYDRQITDMYRDVLGRAPDANGAAYYSAMLNSGMSMEELRRKFILNAQPELQRGFPSYAVGTDFHPGGMAWVGEQGKELVNLPRGAQVIPHQQSMRMANDNSSADLVREVQALRQEVAGLRAERKAGDALIAETVAASGGQSAEAIRAQTEGLRRAQGGRTR